MMVSLRFSLLRPRRGANWLHGDSEGNPILDLARETGTQLHSWGEREVVFDQAGKPLSDKDVGETSEMFWEIIGQAFKYSKERGSKIPVERSLMDYVTEKANELYSDDCEGENKRKRGLLLREAEMWGAFVGGSIYRQSLRFFWLEEGIEGENPFIADTYEKILEAIAKPTRARASILLEQEVTSISTNEQSAPGRVEVVTADSFKAYFDEVVVTLPLGVLQRRKDMFRPLLPDRLSRAIDAIGYGNLDKVGKLESAR